MYYSPISSRSFTNCRSYLDCFHALNRNTDTASKKQKELPLLCFRKLMKYFPKHSDYLIILCVTILVFSITLQLLPVIIFISYEVSKNTLPETRYIFIIESSGYSTVPEWCLGGGCVIFTISAWCCTHKTLQWIWTAVKTSSPKR